MLNITALRRERQELLERIRALKQEICDREPTLDDIARFIQENHPGKQEQRIIEERLRQAQSKLEDIEEATKRVVV